MPPVHHLTAVFGVALALAGCGRAGAPAEPEVQHTEPVAVVDPRAAPAAVAALRPAGGSAVEGTVRLADLGAGVRVTAEVSGLDPGDRYHGLQILASGTCDELGDEPAHFDPDGATHGPFDAPVGARHAGDLGNIRAYDGSGRYDRLDPLVTLSGPRSAVGHAVVLRADRDDAWSDDGDAGEVLACGVLEGR